MQLLTPPAFTFACADREALIEAVAAELWASRVEDGPQPWSEAGTFWQLRFRELAITAISYMERHAGRG